MSDTVFIGDDEQSESPPEKLVVELDGQTIEMKVDANISILENLMQEGHNPPYSCMEGACMACMAKVIKGRAVQDDPGILTEDNIDSRELLTCQAKPVSQVLHISYDEL